MALTLGVSDSGNGTGVATVAGTGGAAVTVFDAPYSGIQGSLAWAVAGGRTGDGTVAVAPGTGQFFWYAATATDQTAPVFQALTDQTQAVHYRCLVAIQQRIQGLALSGIASSAVLVRWMPRSWESVDTLPCVVVAPPGREEQPGILTGRDDIQYPCVVVFLDRGNQDNTANLARNLLWRQRVFRALRHQRLAGVPEIITTDVDPTFVLDEAEWAKNYWHSALLFLPRSREVRG